MNNNSKDFIQIKEFVPYGHFYSTCPNLKDIAYQLNSDKKPKIHFDLRVNEQLELMNEYSKYYNDFKFAKTEADLNKIKGNRRYYIENNAFSYGDAHGLYSFIRHFKPKNIFEIGSGFSSALTLDTIDMFFKSGEINFCCLEPYSALVKKLTKKFGNIEIYEKQLQYLDPKFITDKLNDGDLLFVDSTHVVKAGSDVMFIFDNILPNLKKGVFVHFYDIFYPFTYPKEWLKEGRCWNEAFFLKQFLTNNNKWEIVYWGNMLYNTQKDKLLKILPVYEKNVGASIYLRKVED